MKKMTVFLILVAFSINASAGTLQDKMSGFFDRSTTINIGDGPKTTLVQDSPSASEKLWNVDFYGMDYVFLDQPGPQQFIASITGIGITYKFSEAAHIWGKYTTFKASGVALRGAPTEWSHTHLMGGFGMRFNLADSKRIVFNLGSSISKVEGTRQYGEINNLDQPIVLDTKYLWVGEDKSYGIVLTILEIESKATTWETYHKGGYMSIGFTIQFGTPDLI